MKEIEYFYACHSVFAYLGAWRLAEIAAEHGARVIHKPMDLNPVVAAAGSAPFDARSKTHTYYFFGREITRWAEYRDLPWIMRRPKHHDNPLGLGNGAIIAAQTMGWDVHALSRALLQAHWRDDADPADAATIAAIAESLGMDGAALVASAQSDAVQAQHAANTEEAIARHVLGSPTYFVDGDMFYGQDRLDMVARALVKPFAQLPRQTA
ncbi:2-hydroxychromene-2-carboxylate isomerase [Roseobacter sinensis]|uniref:2-hydroxychromene-2-carboxylate isomerase n=1 Tax=Roseobacter sinensis TaxID=2931391 RepID=A0ABT3BH82_9RHOB|nr:2-hydroxychromene-2-carboxylate isomerase [Roseobacter sp. WL0113]MCV3272926.1 2-hydroxychromene-2-carboxylate isomerase [Roseobacter sp. WL0113]